MARPVGFVQTSVAISEQDQRIAMLNGFRQSVTGSTTCTLTVTCPKSPLGRSTRLVLTDLYATGSGGTCTIASSGSGFTSVVFNIPANDNVHMNFITPITGELAEDITVTIAGASAGAGIVVTGYAVGM